MCIHFSNEVGLIEKAEFPDYEKGFVYARVLAILYECTIHIKAENETYGFQIKQRNDFEIIW